MTLQSAPSHAQAIATLSRGARRAAKKAGAVDRASAARQPDFSHSQRARRSMITRRPSEAGRPSGHAAAERPRRMRAMQAAER